MMREHGAEDKTHASFLCLGRKQAGRNRDKVFECFFQRTGNKDPMEAWPTSPVLMEEKNARQKARAHKYYERQLKACSWYSKDSQRAWIEVVEPYDDSCSECYYKEPCGCVLVSNQRVPEEDRKRCTTSESGRSSLSVPRVDSRASRLSRCSRNSRTSTEDDRSFYDNLCQSCKASTLEKRARKYGEWRRRWSGKMADIRNGEEPTAQCTCAVDNYSFLEWKNLYEQDELVRYSRVHHARPDMVCTSDYGTHKSKDSESTTLCRDSTLRSNVKSSSLGYNTDRDLDSDSSYSSTDVSDSEESGTDDRGTDDVDMDLFNNELIWMHEFDCALEQMKRGENQKSRTKTRKTRPCRTNKNYTKATVSSIPLQKSLSQKKTSFSEGNTSLSEGSTSFPENTTSSSEGNNRQSEDNGLVSETNTLHSENNTLSSEGTALNSETVESNDDGRQYNVTDDGIPVICVTPTDYIPQKCATENDETLPPDPFSEFVEVAKSIDKFYENIHAKQFLKKRVTPNTQDSTEDIPEKQETFSAELKQRIQSLERLCSFVDDNDEEFANKDLDSPFDKQLSFLDDKAVWRLSQQSINLTLSRRSRSTTSSSSNPSRSTSTSGSNSRCSTRQSNYKTTKLSVTSAENICSPDSGFSEKTSSFPALDSPEPSPLGAGWSGSMQWDYTDWTYYFGFDCDEPIVVEEKSLVKENETSLSTIHETPPTPQNPLDWDW